MPAFKKGFTLIELLVTIAVMAIVISVAIPSFKTQINNNKSTAFTDEFEIALSFARNEAVKRARRVSLCPSLDGASCAGADEWAKGWIAFVDLAESDQKDEPVVDTTKFPILRYWEGLGTSAQIDFPAAATIAAASVKSGVALTIPDINPVNFVRFTSLGTLAQVSGNSSVAFLVKMNGCTGFSVGVISVGVAGLISTSYINC